MALLALAWLLLAVLATPAAAQPPATAPVADGYHVTRWTTADGLPQNTVNDITRLSNGDLWLATFGGLARFDGQGFRVLDIASDEGLPDNRILSLQPQGPDAFWFLTHHGHLGQVSGGRAETVVQPPSPTFETLGLWVDAGGRAYTRSVDGSLWVARDARWRRVLGGRGLIGLVHGVAGTDDGHIWAAMGGRIARVEGETVVLTLDVPSGNVILARRRGGGLWVGTERGLLRVTDDRLEAVDVRPRLSRGVTAAAHEHDDVLWVATEGEVSRLERQIDGRWERTSLALPLAPEEHVRVVHPDGHGGVWVGAEGLGLFHVERVPVTRVGREADLRVATGLASDARGGAWVVDWCRGLVHVDAAGVASRVPLRPSPAAAPDAAGCSMAVTGGRDGTAWVRVASRVYAVTDARISRRLPVEVPEEEGPLLIHDDGTLSVVSRGGLVQRLTAEGQEVSRRLLPAPLLSAALAPDGTLWVGSQGAVFHVGARQVQRYGSAEGIPAAEVRDILVERDGSAWIATYGGGLAYLRDGRASRLSALHGLPDNSLSRVLDDGRGRLWLSTNRGVAMVPREDLIAAATGRTSAFMPVVLGPERGVDEATFGSPAGFTSQGRLWFGTITGAVAIDSRRFPFNAEPPVARVERIAADGRPLPIGPIVAVPARTSRLQLEFSASPPVPAQRVRFRFRVDGVDRDWVDAGNQRRVDWGPPPPGRHRLLVEARNEDGVWSQAPTTLMFDVAPAWWQTTAFRLGAVTALALALTAGFKTRLRFIERRHDERVRVLEAQRSAEARASDLRAQLDHVSRVALAGELTASLAHEVSQPLAAMVNNAEAGRRNLPHYLRHPDELAAILGDIVADGMRASDVVRGLRAFLRPRAAEVTRLDLSTVVRDVLPLVSREVRDAQVVLDLALADDLPPVDGVAVQLGQVVVNLLLNACEALSGVEGTRHVLVTTDARDGLVRVAVRDNGPGLSPQVAGRALEPFVTTKPGGLGMGLAICRAIAEAHGGGLTTTSTSDGFEVMLSVPEAQRTT